MKPGQLTLIRLPLKVGDSKKIYSELAPRGVKTRVFYTGDVTSSSEDSVKTLKNPWVGYVIDTLPRKKHRIPYARPEKQCVDLLKI